MKLKLLDTHLIKLSPNLFCVDTETYVQKQDKILAADLQYCNIFQKVDSLLKKSNKTTKINMILLKKN